MFFSQAWAQAAQAASPSLFEQFVPLLVIIGVFIFFVILPQVKRQKGHQSFLQSLKRGDAVLTTGGILGTIEGLTDQYITLEICSDVRIRILRTQIAGPAQTTEAKK
jgi:preprotein translocase subunit YajC